MPREFFVVFSSQKVFFWLWVVDILRSFFFVLLRMRENKIKNMHCSIYRIEDGEEKNYSIRGVFFFVFKKMLFFEEE